MSGLAEQKLTRDFLGLFWVFWSELVKTKMSRGLAGSKVIIIVISDPTSWIRTIPGTA